MKPVVVLSLFLLNACLTTLHASDWPMWRFDANRSAASDLELSETLHLQWVLELPRPKPAWPSNQEKLLFDRLYEPIVANGNIIVPSMLHDTVTAYDTSSGEERWTFFAAAPVRLAPAAAGGRVYFGSDDGHLYCLDTRSGELLWKFRDGPPARWAIGNERLIDLWPARGAPVIFDDTVYFGASIWPFMGTFLHALNAETGEVRWTNSGTGANFHLQQHHSPAFAGVSPQGYFAIAGEKLVVSGGRTVPAVFNRLNGAYEHYVVWSRAMGSKGGGGYEVMAGKDFYINRGKMYRLDNGEFVGNANAAVLAKGVMIGTDAEGLVALAPGFTVEEVINRTGAKTTEVQIKTIWKAPLTTKPEQIFIKSGSRVYGRAANNKIVAIDLPSLTSPARLSWESGIPDRALNMLSADDRLFVTSDQGRIYCFGAEDRGVSLPEPPVSQLIPRGSEWRYLDSGTTPADWKKPEFNDTSWPRGPAILGYGDQQEATLLNFGTDQNKKRIAYYFRHHFDLPTDPPENIDFELLCDDGAVLYLNGEEIGRFFMPDGEVGPETTATAGNPEKGTIKKTIATSALRRGTNVLAAEVHQHAPDSSDVAFDFELRARIDLRGQPKFANKSDDWSRVAATVLRQSGASEGYALALGIGSGRLVEELASQSNLHIVVIDPDENAVGEFRRRLLDQRVYGTRVAAIVGNPFKMDLAPYWANVIVSESPDKLFSGQDSQTVRTHTESIFALLRPFDGVAAFGCTLAQFKEFQDKTRGLDLDQGQLERSGDLMLLRRLDAPTGSGEWTHQYGDSTNAVVSSDRVVKAPLGILWWGGPSNEGILPRHGHGPTPHVAGGRLFIEGRNFMRAIDIYTGRLLWQRELKDLGQFYDYTSHEPGANSIGSNYVSLRDSLYVIYGKQCLRLDPATGETVTTIELPRQEGDTEPPTWGYLGVWKNILMGGKPTESRSPEYRIREITSIAGEPLASLLKELKRLKRFSLVAKTEGQSDHDYLFANFNKLLRDEDMVSHVPLRVRQKIEAAEDVEERLEKYLSETPGRKSSDNSALHIKRELLHHYYGLPLMNNIPIGKFGSQRQVGSKKLVAMDRHSGKVLWEHEAHHEIRHNSIALGGGSAFYLDKMSRETVDFFTRRGLPVNENAKVVAVDIRSGETIWTSKERVFGTWLGYSEEYDILLQAGSRASDRARDEIGRGMVAYRGIDGSVLWQNDLNYSGPCILLGSRVITQGYNHSGFALDIQTGKEETLEHPLSGKTTRWAYRRHYGCNTAIGSPNLLTFRSAAAGYFDLIGQSGTGNFGGFRSGCTSNLIPAGGILNAPDYTRTCTCSYQNQSSLALVHMPDVEMWTFSAVGSDGHSVRQAGLNFGAPGDRRGPDGTLWIDYPSVGGTSPEVPLQLTGEGLRYPRFHTTHVEDGPLPWVGASALEGDGLITMQLSSPDEIIVPNEVSRSGRLAIKQATVSPEVFASKLPKQETPNRHSLRRSLRPGGVDAKIAGFERFASPEVSVELWVRPENDTTLVDATIDGEETKHGYVLSVTGAGKHARIRYFVANEASDNNADEVLIEAKDQLANGTWAHIAFTYDQESGHGRLYVNGTPISEHDGPDGRALWWDSQNPAIRLVPNAGQSLRLDELRVCDQAIDPGQLLISGDSPLPSEQVVGFWRMERESLGLNTGSDDADAITPLPTTSYKLRFIFAELDEITAGDRVFDILVQGKSFLSDFDIYEEAGGHSRVIIREIPDVEVQDDYLRIELRSKTERKAVLNGLQILPRKNTF